MKKTLSFLLVCVALLLPTCSFAKDLAERIVLDNGLVVLLSEQHKLPFVTFSLLVKAGSYYEPEQKAGLAQLTASLLTEGTVTRTANQLSEETDFIGASLEAGAEQDNASLKLTVLKKYLDKGFDVFADVLLHPSFPEAERARAVTETLASIKRVEEEPEELTGKVFKQAVFGSHPYGRPIEGLAETVPLITRQDIVAYHQAYYVPNNAILAVVGDISKEELFALLNKYLGSWQSKPLPVVPTYSVPELSAPLVKKVDKDLTQANIIWGNIGIARSNPDWYAVSVMNYILGGGGFASRLMEKIRQERPLVYGVDSYFEPAYYPGTFQVFMQTKNESAVEAIEQVEKEIKKIRTEPVSDEELESAKSFLTGYFPLRIDTNAKIAGQLLNMEFYGLGLDFVSRYPKLIRAVTKKDVLRVAKKYLKSDAYVLVVVANQAKANVDKLEAIPIKK